MLPRKHIILGAIFTFIIWILAPNISFIYLGLIFLSSFLIDFDHYICAVIRTKSLSLRKAFEYHDNLLETEKREVKKGMKKRSDFHIFHTIEFHALIGLLGIIFVPFLYVFMGMIFHSLLDVFSLMNKGKLHRREYFFFNWLRKRF
jgi:hypothetical protein